MGSAFNTIQAANNGITSISKLAQSAQALVSQAQQNSDPTLRANLASQFDQILLQITTLAGNSGFNGINLLDSNNSSDLTVMLNETGSSSVTISAVDFSATGALAINSSTNNWGGSADIAAASAELMTALTTLRSQAQAFASNLSTVQIRRSSPRR